MHRPDERGRAVGPTREPGRSQLRGDDRVPDHALEPIRVEVKENDQTIEIKVTYEKDDRPSHPVGPPLVPVAFSLNRDLGNRKFVRPDGSMVALT